MMVTATRMPCGWCRRPCLKTCGWRLVVSTTKRPATRAISHPRPIDWALWPLHNPGRGHAGGGTQSSPAPPGPNNLQPDTTRCRAYTQGDNMLEWIEWGMHPDFLLTAGIIAVIGLVALVARRGDES